jgi:hypothetical protein
MRRPVPEYTAYLPATLGWANFNQKYLMELLFTLVIAIALTGCATLSDRRSNPPDIVTFSKKSAKEVALCISEKWESTKPFLAFSSPQVNTSIRTNGYSITATDISPMGSTWTITVADVTEVNSESTTKYYKMGGGGFGDYDQAVKECQ